ncbi:hypothetical protein H072_9853 [Dactylellina haptotyla CBS 200.50]|uniref:Prion-inhibition and propagation HeLo domain-containing protein n=1 Tax=Dactylellina haptotyla (strain CBS 200.50) TaxID=1284197 RepID=S8BN17_DACHA|nr:hypothetical protein H072_9853 [Dactylellina haptotyla CBS 200.50]
MAEVIGLIIGGVSLATLFSAVIGLCECVHFGKSFGQDYEIALTRLSIVRLRLSRWAAAIQEQEQDLATVKDGEIALGTLEQIRQLFEGARELSLKYEGNTALYDPIDGTGRDIRKLVSTVRKVVSQRQKNTRTFRKTVWAVYDKERFNKLLDDVTKLVDGLVELFPAPTLAEKQESLCEEDLDLLIVQNNIPAELVVNATANTDEALRSRLEMRLQTSTHVYIGNEISGNACVKLGDEYLNGFTNPGGSRGNIYHNNTVSGEAFVQFGNTYGGYGFFGSPVATNYRYYR